MADPPSPPRPHPYREVEFPSQGATLRGRLYLPGGAEGPHPALVMAHGFSATIVGMVADEYAEVFREAGCAVLLYDHRNFGVSGGEPRQQVNRWVQTRGYLDALAFLGRTAGIDPERLGLWGDSASGGEALIAAALEPRVRVVLAQVPACGSQPPPPDPDGSLFARLRATILQGDLRAAPENTVGPLPVVSANPRKDPPLLTPVTAFRWFIEYGGRFGTRWENWGTVGGPASPVPLHPGLFTPHLGARVLALIARGDEMPGAEAPVARAAVEAVPGAREIVDLDGGHFGLLHSPGPIFDDSCRRQRAFLERHLVR